MLIPPRILLCASSAHCAQVLQAAAQSRAHLHGLQPSTQWPQQLPAASIVLWALLPMSANSQDHATEQQWRATMLQGAHEFTIQMLYGNAQQQAQQLAPWVRVDADTADNAIDTACWECLDARNEQTLFQHLLAQRP